MSFTVVVKKASQSVAAAREAARYEGVKYCIEKISSSDIRWTVTPEAAELSAQSDTLSIKRAMPAMMSSSVKFGQKAK